MELQVRAMPLVSCHFPQFILNNVLAISADSELSTVMASLLLQLGKPPGVDTIDQFCDNLKPGANTNR